MKNIYIVITNNGDGSNSLQWFKETPYEILKNLDELTGDYETWGSGDGVQITSLTFPKDFDLTSLGLSDWAWSDEDIKEYVYETN